MKKRLACSAVGLVAGCLAWGAAQQVRSEASKQAPAPIVVPAGTVLQVRLDQTVDTARNRSGDRFAATLYAPVAVGDQVILPKGTRFQGRVTSAASSGRLKGRGHLALTLDSFTLDGKRYRISSSTPGRSTASHKKRNLAWIGGGSGGGALIAGLAGGGPWALAGAGIGAASGTAVAALTGKKNVSFPAESLVSFSLRAPVSVTRRE